MIVGRGKRNIRISLAWCVLGATLLGLSVGRHFRPQWIQSIAYVALFLMLYPAMLDVDFAGIKKAFAEPWLVTAALLLNFLVSPLLIYGLLHLFVRGSEPELVAGIALYGMVPGGGMAPAFTGMLKGNVSLTVAISGIGGILSLGITPLWAKWLIGPQMEFPALLILQHLCLIIMIPWTVAMLTRRIVSATRGDLAFRRTTERIKPLSGLGLCLFLFTMSVLHGDRVLDEPFLILKIAGPVSAFLMILFLLSNLLGRMLRSSREDAVALTFSTAAKNNAIALALSLSTFGPDAGLVNAIAGPLVQLPILLGIVALKTGKTT
ncbi:MAG: arsenic resistance protein [Desulfomonile tiedjei]|nr:arsenic resistance protein [Desulfomonile tiedjei]